MSLFPASGGRPGGEAGLLCEFKSGKCAITTSPNAGGKYTVTPDKDKRGMVSLVKSPFDQLVHFKYTNSLNGAVEDDRIVFPGDCTFKKVKTGRDADRVFMLQMESNKNQPMMFWMQDVTNAQDDANATKLNTLNANPNAAVAAADAPAAGAAAAVGSDAWMSMLMGGAAAGGSGGLDFASLLSAATPSAAAAAPAASSSSTATATSATPATTAAVAASPTPAAAAPSSSSSSLPTPPPLTLAQLQSAMQATFNINGSSSSSSSAATPPLQDILTADEVMATGVLQDPAVQSELMQHLPEGQQTAANLEATIRSPQFIQALGSLSNAVSGPDNYQSVMSNFSINPAPGMGQQLAGDGVGAFLTSLSAANPAESKTAEEKKEDEKKEGEEGEGKMEE